MLINIKLNHQLAIIADQPLIQSTVQAAIVDLGKTLGLHIQPTINIEIATANQSELAQLTVDNQRLHYALPFLNECVSYAFHQNFLLESESQWIQGMANIKDVKSFAFFIRHWATALIKEKASVLLAPEVFEQLQEDFRTNGLDSKIPSDQLQTVCSELLNYNIAFTDKVKIAELLNIGFGKNKTTAQIFEDCYDVLATPYVSIHIDKEYFKLISQYDIAAKENPFGFFFDNLFYQTGILFPAFRFKYTTLASKFAFAIQINDLVIGHLTGILPTQFLVPISVQDAKQTDPKISWTSPADFSNLAQIETNDPTLKNQNSVFTQLSFILLQLNAKLTAKASYFLTNARIQKNINDTTVNTSYPQLINLVRKNVSNELITATMRALVSEGISLKDYPLILESIVSRDMIPANPNEYIVLDDRLTHAAIEDKKWLDDPIHATAFVRTKMKAAISLKYTNGSNSLKVHLLDQDLENKILASPQLSESDWQQLQARIFNSIDALYNDYNLDFNILTIWNVRYLLRQMIEVKFPHINVLAYRELSPSVNLYPLEKVSV